MMKRFNLKKNAYSEGVHTQQCTVMNFHFSNLHIPCLNASNLQIQFIIGDCSSFFSNTICSIKIPSNILLEYRLILSEQFFYSLNEYFGQEIHFSAKSNFLPSPKVIKIGLASWIETLHLQSACRSKHLIVHIGHRH